MNKLIINTDGASRANPGQAAAAYIIYDERGGLIFEAGLYLGVMTNNEAEYLGVKLALECIRDKLAGKIPALVEVRSDSMLIVNQLMGVYKVKNARLKQIHAQVKDLEKEVGLVRYSYIARAKNSQADKLANQILDQHSV